MAGKFLSSLGSIFKMMRAIRLQSIATAIANIFSGEAALGPIGLGIAAAAVGGMVGMIASIKDGMIDPKGGLVVSGEKGTYKLDPNDSIIAGTDINKPGSKSQSNQSSGGTTNIDISPLIAEMQGMRNILNQILQKEGGVYLDSTKVGTALNIGTYKTQ